jgi:hypothetical protein
MRENPEVGGQGTREQEEDGRKRKMIKKEKKLRIYLVVSEKSPTFAVY